MTRSSCSRPGRRMLGNLASRACPRRRLLLPLLVTVIIGPGCSIRNKRPPPLHPPAVSSNVSYRWGSPTASPTTRPAEAIAFGHAIGLRTRWVALARFPQKLRPILSDASLIASPRSADPFLAAGQLSRDAWIVPADEVEPFLVDIERGTYGQRADI